MTSYSATVALNLLWLKFFSPLIVEFFFSMGIPLKGRVAMLKEMCSRSFLEN